MSEIRFPCSGCGVTLRITNPALAGKKLKCPKCAALTVIPAPADEVLDVAEVVPEVAPAAGKSRPAAREAVSDEPRRRPRTAATSTTPAPSNKNKAAPGRSKRGTDPDDEDDHPRARTSVKKKRRPKVLDIVVASLAAVIAIGYLGAVAAGYFGLIGYRAEPVGNVNATPLAQGNPPPQGRLQPQGGFPPGQRPPNGRPIGQPGLPNGQPFPQPGPGIFLPPLQLPPPNAVEEARLAKERETKRQAAAAQEQQLLTALRQARTGREQSGGALLWHDNQRVTQLVFSADTRFLAGLTPEGNIKVWDLQTATLKPSLPDSEGAGQLAFSPDGKTLAAVCLQHKVQLWDVTTGQLVRVFAPMPPRQLEGVAFSPDGKWVFSGGQVFERMEVTTGPAQALTVNTARNVHHFAVRPDGKIFAATTAGGALKLWNIEAGNTYQRVFMARLLQSLTFSPDGWSSARGDESGDTAVGVAALRNGAQGRPTIRPTISTSCSAAEGCCPGCSGPCSG